MKYPKAKLRIFHQISKLPLPFDARQL